MVESDLGGAEGAKAIGFSQRQLQTIIEPLGGATGDLLVGPEPIQQQRFMRPAACVLPVLRGSMRERRTR